MANPNVSVTTLSIALIVAFTSLPRPLCAEDPVFSGPQVGEQLPEFQVRVVAGSRDARSEEDSKENSEEDSEENKDAFDPVVDAGTGPVLLIFFHELTRPGFGLTRAVANFASKRADKGMKSTVIFLTDDPTATRKWASNVRQHFADGVTYAISMDGDEGPGAYGLNRNVTLTVLVGKDGKVTSNFALVQPQLQADGPKILQAIVDVTGGGAVPDVAELEPRYSGRNRMAQNGRGRTAPERGQRGAQDEQLTSLLRSVINKNASADDVREAAKKVEAYVNEHDSARNELARIVNTVVNSGKISNYGTETAQEFLRKWQKAYPQESKPNFEE